MSSLEALARERTIRVALADLNGQMRGKRLPGAHGPRLAQGAVRVPYSVINVDVEGADIEASPLVFQQGDPDGILMPTGRGPVPVPWVDSTPWLVPMWMHDEAARPWPGDPRVALDRVLARYRERGWQVLAATEMEFTLVDDSGDSLQPPRDPLSGRRSWRSAILSMRQLDAWDPFITALYDGAEVMGIPAQATISEVGVGQFEINLHHQEAMRAADDAWLFKALVRGTARRHGMAATFMAKPYPDDAGNGMHVHFSVLDAQGRNVFDDGTARGSDLLLNAIAGCLRAMPGSTLIFAPHGNSYERLVPGAHAPTRASWAYENRTAAVRVPGGPPAARRIEHRVPGGDTNPYLVLAAILGAAMHGIDERLAPPPPVEGNAWEHPAPELAHDWADAVNRFAEDPDIARIFAPTLVENLVLTKRQEIAKLSSRAPETLWQTWLEAV